MMLIANHEYGDGLHDGSRARRDGKPLDRSRTFGA
jgi:hypothetical protein